MTSNDVSSDAESGKVGIVTKATDGQSRRGSWRERFYILDPLSGGFRVPLNIPAGAPVLVIRRTAYEARGLNRTAIDERAELTQDESRLGGGLVVVGPIYAGADALAAFIDDLEQAGLVYFDDFFELSGNRPDWLHLFAGA